MFGLTEEDMERLDPKGITELIEINKKRLTVWSLSERDRKQIREEIKELEKLLRLCQA